jgi:hypothetical protein
MHWCTRALDSCRNNDRGFAKVSELIRLIKKVQIQSQRAVPLGSVIKWAISARESWMSEVSAMGRIAMFPTIGRATSFYICPAMRKFCMRLRIVYFWWRGALVQRGRRDTRYLNSWLPMYCTYQTWLESFLLVNLQTWPKTFVNFVCQVCLVVQTIFHFACQRLYFSCKRIGI